MCKISLHHKGQDKLIPKVYRSYLQKTQWNSLTISQTWTDDDFAAALVPQQKKHPNIS